VFGNPRFSKRHQSLQEIDFTRTTALPLRLRLVDTMISVCAECEARDPKNIIAGFKSDLERERRALSKDLESLGSRTAIDRLQTTHAIIREKLAPDPSKLSEYDHAAKVLQEGFAAYSLYAKRDFWCQVLEDSIARVRPSYLIRRERFMTKGDLIRMKERLYSLSSRATSVPCCWLLEEPARRSLSEALLAAELERAREDLGKDDPLVVGVLDGQSFAELSKALGKDDSLVEWIVSMRQELDEKAAADLGRDFEKANATIASSFEAAFGDAYPPDANGTPRFSYGEVGGWTKGQECMGWKTTFESFLELVKKDGGLVPARWLAAADKENGAITHSFSSTCDALPGNSGGAVVDCEGNLRGLMTNGSFNEDLFDSTTMHSTGLDIDVILLVLRKVYGSEELAREITGRT
jgi:hypothetical protein